MKVGWRDGVATLLVAAIIVPYIGARPAPDELLAERFARGEIDEQEYRRRLDTVHGRSSPAVRS